MSPPDNEMGNIMNDRAMTEEHVTLMVGFGERTISYEALREVQRAFLCGSLTDDQRAIVDACLSRIAQQCSS